jgi:hypothetical protein
MKGTLISSDYVKDRNGDIRFIELNTDTVLYDEFLEHDADWDQFTNYLNSNSVIDTVHLIYKAELHLYAVLDMKAHIEANCPQITTITLQNENLHSIYPTAVADVSNKFILKLVYDGNSILDTEYAAVSVNPLLLCKEYNYESLVVPFHVAVSGSADISTLVTQSNAQNVPDVVYKSKTNVFSEVSFGKVSDWDTVKSDLSSSYYMTNFEIHQDNINDGFVKSYRNYGIVYGPTLAFMDLGTYTSQAKFDIPETSSIDWDTTSNWKFPVKHTLEYSTSTWKTKDVIDGAFETETFVSASGENVAIGEFVVGQEMKSFHVPGSPNTDDPNEYLQWFQTGSTWPANSAITSSIVTHTQQSIENKSGILYKLTMYDSSSFYFGGSTSAMVYNHTKGGLEYKAIFQLNPDTYSLLDLTGSLAEIADVELLQLSTPTGSFFLADIETTDNLVIGDNPWGFMVHNAKSY